MVYVKRSNHGNMYTSEYIIINCRQYSKPFTQACKNYQQHVQQVFKVKALMQKNSLSEKFEFSITKCGETWFSLDRNDMKNVLSEK